MDYKYYPKTTAKELNQVLAFYDADKIVLGHMVKDDITKEFNGKTINTDIKHGKEKIKRYSYRERNTKLTTKKISGNYNSKSKNNK